MTDRRLVQGALAPLVLALLSACSVSPKTDAAGRYATPIGAAPVTDNTTPYSAALTCLSDLLPGQRPRVAVGRIDDLTAKIDEDGGRQITQGASLMAISALGRLGIPLVERLDDSVARSELTLANNNLVGDDGEVRQIAPGSVQGSDLFLVGGITELNYNIGSVAQEGLIGAVGATHQVYALNVALDLRLVETESLEIVEVIGLQKQILGREVRAGVFDFFDGTLIDLSTSERALEPMQMGVRAMVEHAVAEMARSHFGLDPDSCAPPTEAGADTPDIMKRTVP